MEDANLGHVPSDRSAASRFRQRMPPAWSRGSGGSGNECHQPHVARLGDLNQQQIQLLQRVWHSWQETFASHRSAGGIFVSAFLAALVHVKERRGTWPRTPPTSGLAFRARRRRPARSRPTRTEHLVYRGEEAFDAAAAPRLAGNREDQPDFQISAYLFQMLGGEITLIGCCHGRCKKNS